MAIWGTAVSDSLKRQQLPARLPVRTGALANQCNVCAGWRQAFREGHTRWRDARHIGLGRSQCCFSLLGTHPRSGTAPHDGESRHQPDTRSGRHRLSSNRELAPGGVQQFRPHRARVAWHVATPHTPIALALRSAARERPGITDRCVLTGVTAAHAHCIAQTCGGVCTRCPRPRTPTAGVQHVSCAGRSAWRHTPHAHSGGDGQRRP
jgi:hypothetical protein